MKSYIKGEHISLQQWGIDINKLILRTSLEDIGIDIEAKLSVDENKIFDNLLEQTIDECWILQESANALYDANKNWEYTKLTRFFLATIVTKMVYTAIHKLTEANRSVFTCYVSEAKDKLRAYLNKQYSVENRKNYYTITNQNLINFLWIDGESKTEANEETGDRQLLLQIINQLSEVKQAIASTPVHNQISWFSVDTWFELPAPSIVASNTPATAYEWPVELDRNITLWATHQMDMGWFKMKVQNIQVDPKLLAANRRRKDAKKL